MGILNFLKFTLLLIDLLAWPVFALGYPLCASIRAIESGTKYHMRKLIIYWTLFSLISLFELAFIKLIEWIPLWSLIKFIAICSLVMPRFDGACYVYQRLVNPCSSVNVRALVSRLCKPNEEQSLMTETLISVTERYIKENGSEAFENLMKSKISNTLNLKCKEPDNFQKDIQQLDKIDAATIEQPKCKEADKLEKDIQQLESIDIQQLESIDKIDAATIEQLKCKEPEVAEKDINALEPPEKIALTTEEQCADVEIPEKILREEAYNRLPEVPVKQVQREWACALCQVTTSSEQNLISHLQGSKHKAKWDELNRCKQDTKSRGSSPSVTHKSKCGNHEPEKGSIGEGSNQNHVKSNPKSAGSNQRSKLWCNICKVKLLSEIDLAAHLLGSRHSENIQNMSKVKQTTLQGDGSSQRSELWCDICKVKMPGETQLVDHLRGRKHSENIQILSKVKQTTLHGAGSSQRSRLWCNICKVKLYSEIDLTAHLLGSRHSENIQNMSKVKQTTLHGAGSSQGSKLWCNICKVKMPGEIDLVAHLRGRKHTENIQNMSKV